jgi:hypothetical protein
MKLALVLVASLLVLQGEITNSRALIIEQQVPPPLTAARPHLVANADNNADQKTVFALQGHG